MDSGIYTITNLINNKIYVGSSISISSRLKNHLNCLKSNIHRNKHLQRAFIKYGEENFRFELLEECGKDYCLSSEQYWMNMLNSYNMKYGYNILPNSSNSSGYKHDDKTREYLSKIKLGNNPSLSTKLKISEAHKGIKFTENRKRNISKALLGKKKSENCKLLISKSKSNEIIQLDLNNNPVNIWNSAKEVSKTLKIDKNNIRACCRGVYKSAGGFKWRYKNEIRNI